MKSIFNLKAITRLNIGSSESRRIRKAGQIPAVIYNKSGQNFNIAISSKDFEYQYFKGNILTTVVDLDLDGKKLQVIPRKVALNPVSDRPEHVDFVQFTSDAEVKVKTKINFTNQDKSIGLKRGGFLHIVLRKIEVFCSPDSIPQSIDVDISALRVGSKIRGHDLILPEGLKLVCKPDVLVASIIGRGSKDDDKLENGQSATTTSATTAASGATKPAAGAKSASTPAAKPAAGAKSASTPAAKKPAAKK